MAVVTVPFKICNTCGAARSVEEFSADKQKRDGVRGTCKPCRNAETRRRYGDDQHRARQQSLSRSRKYLYGLTTVDYEAFMAARGNRCEVCSSVGPLCIDHDHATRQLRGVLCKNCNNALGLFKDTPEYLRRAAAYLERTVRP